MNFALPSWGLNRNGAAWLVTALLAVAGMARAQDGLKLTGDSVEGLPGQEVTLFFKADGYWEILQGRGTIQWDPHVMDYVSAGHFAIGAITEGSFTRIPEGKLEFQWLSSADFGNTLPNGTTLFSLTFQVRGDPGDTTTVAFNNSWTPLYFQSAVEFSVPFSSVPGNVTVVPEPGTTAVLMAVGLLVLVVGRYRGLARSRRDAEKAGASS